MRIAVHEGSSADRRAPERESPDEARRHIERYQELLQELRVILPGVQVLFAFLLTAPFSGRFGDLDDVGRDLYLTTLGLSAASLLVLMSPVAYHRLTDRHDRARRVRAAIRLKLAGLFLLAAAIACGVYVVTRFVFGPTVAAVLTAIVGLVAVGSWVALPLLTGRHEEGVDGFAR